jgi:hypothetical protein
VDKTLKKAGFVPTGADPCVYSREGGGGRLGCILAIHVDDCMVAAAPGEVEKYKQEMKDAYRVSDDGETSWFLKVRVDWGKDRRSVSLSQRSYVEEMLRECQMGNSRPQRTPARPNVVLVKGKGEATKEDKAGTAGWERARGPFRRVVGKLGYLAGCTRPDISFAVRQLQKQADDVRPEHCQAVDHVLSYLQGTAGYGLRFERRGEKGEAQLRGWADSDHGAEIGTVKEGRRSRLGYAFMMMNAVLSWGCVQSDRNARSTAESEIMALDEAAREGLWLRRLGMELRLTGADCIPIGEDNAACEAFADGGKVGDRLKHVDTIYHAVRDNVDRKELRVEPVSTKENLADFFTKSLGPIVFEGLRRALGVVCVA